jgi:hypothetical protein
MEYLFAHRLLTPLDPLGDKLRAHAEHRSKVLLPNSAFDAPRLYSFDDFLGSLAHTSNVSRYTHSVNTSCAYYTNSVVLQCVNTRWSDFITGFLIGVLAGEKYSFCPIYLRVAATPYASCGNISIDPAGT